MKDSFKYDGYWWLPETPENKIFGQLTFIPGDELTIKVQGILNIDSDKNDIFSPDFINPQFIHGIIQDKSAIEKNVTIYKCQQTGSSMSGSGLQSSSFMGMAAFIGVHFNAVEQLEFKSISVHLSNIEMWSNRNPITVASSDNNAGRIIQYTSQDSTWAKTDDMDVQIFFYGPITSYSFTETTVSYETRVEITQHEETKFEKYLETIRRLQNFFSLAIGAATYPIGLIGQSNANKVISENKKEIFLPIDIYYLSPSWPKQIKPIHSNEMLFTLTAIESSFEKCIQNWIKKYELLEPAINLYFSVLYNPSNFVEVRFLSLAQAIETYHRRLFDGKYQVDDIYRVGLYNELVKVVPKELDSDFRKSLEGRLKYGNEYSLRTRLRKVIEGVTDILDFNFIQSKPERATFINKVIDTRNYWTHYTSELAEKAVQTGEERLILITQLQLLLEVCFLNDLGFDTNITSDL